MNCFNCLLLLAGSPTRPASRRPTGASCRQSTASRPSHTASRPSLASRRDYGLRLEINDTPGDHRPCRRPPTPYPWERHHMTRPESGVRYVMVIDAEPRSERSSDERLKRRSRNKSIRELEKKIAAQNAEISGRPAQPVRYDMNERGAVCKYYYTSTTFRQ